MAPRRTSIRIGASSADSAGSGNATNLSFRVAAGATGIAGADWARSASTTQRLSKFALIDRVIAAEAIEVPGCRQAATASALNCSL
jgi:hypothetical protein